MEQMALHLKISNRLEPLSKPMTELNYKKDRMILRSPINTNNFSLHLAQVFGLTFMDI